MAAMYGRIEWYGDRTCGCCWLGKSKRQQRRIEQIQWRSEAFEELADPAHAHGICSNPKTGMGGCSWCYGDDDYDPYDNADLEGISGVWCDVDWRTA